MESRMDRYQSDHNNTKKPTTRIAKNQKLYEDFYTKPVYKEITPVPVEDLKRVIHLDEIKQETKTREAYHNQKDFLLPNRQPERKSKDLSHFFQEEEKKNYDINDVLALAKKNREIEDEKETRRNLRNTDYNILAGMKPEEIEQIHAEKEKTKEEELEELIHTITSKSLADDIKEQEEPDDGKELLSDLMPTSANETVISEELSKQILDKENIPEEKAGNTDTIDRSFYTKSMDLTDEDFDEEGLDDEFVEKEHPVRDFLKVFIAVIIVVGIAVAVFYFLNRL